MLFVLAVAREDDIFFNSGWRLLLGIFISSKVVEQAPTSHVRVLFHELGTTLSTRATSSMLLIQKKGLQNTLAYKTCRLLAARAGESLASIVEWMPSPYGSVTTHGSKASPTRTIHQSSFTLLPPRQNKNLLPLPPYLIQLQVIFPSAEKKTYRVSG
jgi:hypothetical protein